MKIDIVRAWKDAAYRASLSAEELAQVPANPAGAVELSDTELEMLHGAYCAHGRRGVSVNIVNQQKFVTGVDRQRTSKSLFSIITGFSRALLFNIAADNRKNEARCVG